MEGTSPQGLKLTIYYAADVSKKQAYYKTNGHSRRHVKVLEMKPYAGGLFYIHKSQMASPILTH